MDEKYVELNKLILNIANELTKADKKYYRPYGEFIVFRDACENIKTLILINKNNILGDIKFEEYK